MTISMLYFTRITISLCLVDYVGCFVDGVLTDNVGAVPTERTPDNCLRACQKMSFSYAGLIAGNICKCGKTRPRHSMRELEFDCDLKCDGDTLRLCGGATQQSVYHIRMDEQGNQISILLEKTIYYMYRYFMLHFLLFSAFSMVANEDKTEWTTSGTSHESPDAAVSYIVDGNFMTKYMSEYMHRPWIQIDLKNSHHIRAVKLYSK